MITSRSILFLLREQQAYTGRNVGRRMVVARSNCGRMKVEQQSNDSRMEVDSQL